MRNAISRALIALVVFYQRYISVAMAPRCRFIPTCSTYARECFQRYGLCKALLKSVWRLLRCHPLCSGGYDPP